MILAFCAPLQPSCVRSTQLSDLENRLVFTILALWDGHPITAHYVLVRQASRHLKSGCYAACTGT